MSYLLKTVNFMGYLLLVLPALAAVYVLVSWVEFCTRGFAWLIGEAKE